MKNKIFIPVLLTSLLLVVGCTDETVKEPLVIGTNTAVETVTKEEKPDIQVVKATEPDKETQSTPTVNKQTPTTDIDFSGYTLIEVDGGNLSGQRQANVVVNIGFGDNREYWAFTNEHGQLIRVVAKEIIIQDDKNEPVLSNGRYYRDEAKVPGVESEHLDEGHIIADSLGGVSNAYNITPQNSTLNRHGDQAYMEDVIRKAGGATNFEAIITYPNTKTQIPSKYKYTYTVKKGNTVTDEFENVNPDEVNESLGLTTNNPPANKTTNPATPQDEDLSKVDTNNNGIVTIKEAKEAGFKMPISSDHWLYKHMKDNDGDGFVGE